jgi:opacity protein-like surface antigen
MVSVKVMAFAGAAALFSTAATAADLPDYPPTPFYEAGGWYLRGDIGMSNQRVGSLFNALYDTAISVTNVHKEFDSAPIFGLGVGYQFNQWLRVDVTGEYRGGASFHGLDIVESAGPITTANEYRAIKSEWLVLANIYADLGTWYSFTPFIGAGVGGSANRISGFTDVCAVCAGPSVAFGDTATKWNFAWALHAGIAYRVTPAFTIEFAYRYVNLGDALAGDLVTYDGTNAIYNPTEFRDISSHDLRFGVRWMLAPLIYPEPPMMRRG